MLTPIISTLALALFAWNRNDGRFPKTRLINTFVGGVYGFGAGILLASMLASTVPREVKTGQIDCAKVVKPYILIHQPSDGKLPTGSTSCFKTEVKVQQPTGLKRLFAAAIADTTTYEMRLNVPSNSK
jgi:hypothetical protein